ERGHDAAGVERAAGDGIDARNHRRDEQRAARGLAGQGQVAGDDRVRTQHAALSQVDEALAAVGRGAGAGRAGKRAVGGDGNRAERVGVARAGESARGVVVERKGTGSGPPGGTASPVGKKRRVLLGPRGPNGGGRNSGGSLQASVQRTRRSRNFLDMRAAFLGPMAPPVKTISRPAIWRSRRAARKA